MTDDVARSRQAAVDRRLKERQQIAGIVHDAMCEPGCRDDPMSWQIEWEIADKLLADGWRKS